MACRIRSWGRGVVVVAFVGFVVGLSSVAYGQVIVPPPRDPVSGQPDREYSPLGVFPKYDESIRKPQEPVVGPDEPRRITDEASQQESEPSMKQDPSRKEPERKPETIFIPSLRIAERYDSNVYFVPGKRLEDYVTTVSPQLRIVHKQQLVQSTIAGGVTAEAYAKNPGLNYVAANGMVDLNLDGLVQKIATGLQLRLLDTFYYSPQPPSFAAPTGGSQVPESFVRGIQVQRTNSFTNMGKAEAAYFFSPVAGLATTYTDQRIRFGRAFTLPDGAISQKGFIDTDFRTVSTGPIFKPTPLDTLKLSHLYQQGGFKADGPTNDFTTQGVMVSWSRQLTPTLKATVDGGVTVMSISSSLQPLGSASVEWVGRQTEVTLSYSRVIAPSFFFVGTPLLSQMVAGAVTHRISKSFWLSLNGNYAVNESIPDASLLKFTAYSVMPSVNYAISRIVTATLSYMHSGFQQAISSQGYAFDRDTVLLSFFVEWK